MLALTYIRVRVSVSRLIITVLGFRIRALSRLYDFIYRAFRFMIKGFKYTYINWHKIA